MEILYKNTMSPFYFYPFLLLLYLLNYFYSFIYNKSIYYTLFYVV